MSRELLDDFLFLDIRGFEGHRSAEDYQKLVHWAGQARGRNPSVFDALTEWVLDDTKWNDASLPENEWIFMQGVLARFKDQNARLRALLTELQPLGIVNQAVFQALDRFDGELSGNVHDQRLSKTVAKVFADFSAMRERSVRKEIAGEKTGPTGTNSVELFGYINVLKDCDAGVQWALFMPDMVKAQTKGFQVDSFEYRTMPAMRFIGFEGEEYSDTTRRMEKMRILDTMQAYASGFDHDLLLMHHYGLGVDVGQWHGVWGRFMQKDAPAPDGFLALDFVPEDVPGAGLPYMSRFAFATFSGDMQAMHAREGFDSDAMYDVTRNIILGEGGGIPYPDKYWTAEVFFDGCDKCSTGYLFSACT